MSVEKNDTIKIFKAGETLVAEGARGASAYIIEKGQVEVLIQRDGQMIQIGTRGPGSIIGEMAIVDDMPRVATVRALEDVETLEISRADFTRRLEAADPVLKMVMRVILTRYRDMLSRSTFPPRLPKPEFANAEDMEKSDKSHEAALGEIKVYHELRHALQNEELSLSYQPIIELATGKIAGFEALMRWNNPRRGAVSPALFIPVAEESGLIVDLTRWAFAEACSAIKLLQNSAGKSCISDAPLFMSVNFSVKDFATEDLFDYIDETLRKKSLSPDIMHLEITETLLMQQPDAAKQTLEKCRARGVHISIDDFGSGYSSLSYLHHFPIDNMKIDQSFIRSMLEQDNSRVLVRSIIGLASNLNMRIIAEGIEKAAEASAIRDLGGEYGQGYWFARPAPLAQALELVKNWKQPAF